MRRRARTQVELDFRKALLHGRPFIRLEVTEFANGNRLHRFHFKLGGRDRLHGVVAPASLWATRISHPIPAPGRDDRPQNAPEGRSGVSRPKPCPPHSWDPHGPDTASQRTLARFRVARRARPAPDTSPCHDKPSFDCPRQYLLIELQGDLFSGFPLTPADPSPQAGAFSSTDRAGREVAALVTPQLSPMGGTFRTKFNQAPERRGGRR